MNTTANVDKMPETDIQPGLVTSSMVTVLLTLVIAYAILGDIPNIGSRYRKLPGVPIVGAAFSFEPNWFTRYRFATSGWSVIHNGWMNVRSGLFTIIRPESNVTVIPRRYIGELANMPEDKLAAVESLVNDLMGHYTRLDTLLSGHLGTQAIKRKLTPQLDLMVSVLEDEIMVAAREDPLPVTSDWSEQKIGPYISKLMAQLNSRLFVGVPLCRNKEWLKQNQDFVVAVFETCVIMRNIPRFLHPLAGAMLPARKRLHRAIQQLDNHLISLITERQSQAKIQGSAHQQPQDILQWMMDCADEEQSKPENLAKWYEVTILGTVSTVVEVVQHCIYELCVRPEYIDPIREEMEGALKGEGWSKRAAAKMSKTDSFMKEVFRHCPPGSIAFRRITKEEIVLSDGLVLPKNTYVCVATTTPAQDDLDDADFEQFDGFRYHKKRNDEVKATARHDFATTDKSHIAFGHGRYACPGRFAAGIEIKMLLAHVLLQYDIQLVDGAQDRPRTMKLLEFQFLDPEAVIMVRKRT